MYQTHPSRHSHKSINCPVCKRGTASPVEPLRPGQQTALFDCDNCGRFWSSPGQIGKSSRNISASPTSRALLYLAMASQCDCEVCGGKGCGVPVSTYGPDPTYDNVRCANCGSVSLRGPGATRDEIMDRLMDASLSRILGGVAV